LGAILLLTALQGSWVVLQAMTEDGEQDEKLSPQAIRGCLMVLDRVIRAYTNIPDSDTSSLRLTVHRAVQNTADREIHELEQVVDYVGGDGSGTGRRFKISCGIIGRCAREKKIIAASRLSEDPSEFISELIQKWGFTEKEAKALDPTRRSWMAIPITDSHSRLEGVIYLDSAKKDFFSNPQTYEMCVSGCVGTAAFINWHYGGA
jgi:hypothetical protein